ncbi:heme o synthase [Bradyrhizobium sp.]|uniref:heme o synthase n=1 Tax=Bradyrhizobium sp. TaxID=376 RepID=UPI0025BF225A|nr:heme o synthase [Bradyrhizobium sp.]
MTTGAVDHNAIVPRWSVAQERISDHLALVKPRVMALVVFTGAVGFVLGRDPVDWLALGPILGAMAAGAGACGALNMWYDADIDQRMTRTASRPIPRGSIVPAQALALGIVLALASTTALAVMANGLAAALLALTIAIYVPLYTIWLKRRTPQNIVIGGAAGALPPVIGWAAATGSIGPGAIALFMLIFFWTPPHFWSLAIYRADDYRLAGVPMLPVVRGAPETCRQILIYVLLLVPISFAPLVSGRLGMTYAAAAAICDAILIWRATLLFRLRAAQQDQLRKAAMQLFRFSILYVLALFVAIPVSVLVW